uniref:J domain-containing protein n=2 Tax=Globodera pallida TaxID=36090 RepID=A0A183C1G6_GLOPA
MLNYRKENVSNDQPTSSNKGADRQQLVRSGSGPIGPDGDRLPDYEAHQLKPCGDKAQIRKACKQPLALNFHPDKLEPDRTTDSALNAFNFCGDFYFLPFMLIQRRPRSVNPTLVRIDNVDLSVSRHSRCCIERKADDATLNVLNKRNMKQQRINCSSSVSNVFLKLVGYNYMPIMSPLAYMDQTVVELLFRLRRLFYFKKGTNVCTTTDYMNANSWKIICETIWPYVYDNICSLRLGPLQFYRLGTFSAKILSDCENLSVIDSGGSFHEFSANDNENAPSARVWINWLFSPREDGMPKMLLNCGFNATGIEGLKWAFDNASVRVNFIIRLYSFAGIEQFKRENNLGEQLTLQRFNKDYWLLVRSPMVRDGKKWDEWQEDVIKWKWNSQQNRIVISLTDDDIGGG